MPGQPASSNPGGVATDLSGLRVCILRAAPVDHDKRTQQIARLLAAAGATVTIVALGEHSGACMPEGVRFKAVERIASSSHPVRFVRIASNLCRNKWRASGFFRAAHAAVRETNANFVHCMNVDTLLVGFLVARGASVIYDSREHFATTGTVKRRTRSWWMLKERVLVPRAAAVLTVSEPIAQDLAQRYGIVQPTVLLNGCTAHVRVAAAPHRPLRLIHQGKFFFDRHIEDIIEAVVRQNGKAVLTLQGWGEAEKLLRERVDQLGAREVVRFEAPCPPGQVVASASAHDVGVINIWPDNASHRWAAPNKLFDYMGAGLAQLVSNLEFVRGVVEREECGVVFDPPTVDSISAAIETLVENPGAVASMKRNAVAAAERYTWDAQAPALWTLYLDAFTNRAVRSRGMHSELIRK